MTTEELRHERRPLPDDSRFSAALIEFVAQRVAIAVVEWERAS